MRRPIIAAALLLTAVSCPAFAQSPADHENHHPGAGELPTITQPAPSVGQPGERQGMKSGGDMMGGGMMGRGMMGRGMMGGEMMGPPIMFRMMFALMDADGDGTISLSEFQVAHERIFKAMDSNKDGKLTMEEMLTFMHGTRSSGPR
ncbi:EF-hand domain-containing protein [Bradyrhizobium liaoningense]|uniref:EF-hand domain-containing protein n=1 Tax=Bradyrhizobium liaoningense TaxID=43992 RepID=UPI001BA831DE|nr:EF-hand domain-containing protein [Bradyrhizobium liaoningense]MBR0857022.1 EF-hand domain-containing protein [Bradyrhizobium liaoningense]